MTTKRRIVFAALGCGLGTLSGLTLGGCGMHAVVKQMADRYHIECAGPLGDCLAQLAPRCGDYGYDVLAGTERRAYSGSPPEGYESVRSEATVRCRQAKPMFGADPNEPPPAVSAPPHAVSLPPPAVSPPPPVAPAPSPAASAPSPAAPAP